jgi:hypothetical protein
MGGTYTENVNLNLKQRLECAIATQSSRGMEACAYLPFRVHPDKNL